MSKMLNVIFVYPGWVFCWTPSRERRLSPGEIAEAHQSPGPLAVCCGIFVHCFWIKPGSDKAFKHSECWCWCCWCCLFFFLFVRLFIRLFVVFFCFLFLFMCLFVCLLFICLFLFMCLFVRRSLVVFVCLLFLFLKKKKKHLFNKKQTTTEFMWLQYLISRMTGTCSSRSIAVQGVSTMPRTALWPSVGLITKRRGCIRIQKFPQGLSINKKKNAVFGCRDRQILERS